MQVRVLHSRFGPREWSKAVPLGNTLQYILYYSVIMFVYNYPVMFPTGCEDREPKGTYIAM